MRNKAPVSAIVSAALALSLLAAACGDSETTTSRVPSPSPSPEAIGTSTLPALDLGLERTYRVLYQTTSPDGETGDLYSVFNKPPYARVDTIPAGSTEPISSIIGTEDTSVVTCSGGPGSWECIEAEPPNEPLLALAGPVILPTTSDLEELAISETEGRTLAGQATQCYRLSARQGGQAEDVEYCFKDGIVLYARTGSGTVEATEFSTDVSDQDFVPPAEPRYQR